MINKVILMGRLTADPELRQTPSGVSICRFRIAVNRSFVSKDTGERQSDFINIIAWRNTADFVARYFSKGKMIIVEGSLRNNDYTDQNGVKHYSMEVQADNVTFGESKSAASGGNFAGVQPQYNQQPAKVQQQYQKPSQNAQKNTQRATQHTLDKFVETNYDIGDLSEYEVLSDGDVPF